KDEISGAVQPEQAGQPKEVAEEHKKHEITGAVQPEQAGQPKEVVEEHKEPEIPETDHQIVTDLTLAEDQHLSSAQATPDTLEELTADLLFRREESNFEVQVVVYGIVEEVGLQIKPSSTEEIIKPKLSELYPASPEQAGQPKEVLEEHKKDDISGAVQPEQAGQPKEVVEQHKKDEISGAVQPEQAGQPKEVAEEHKKDEISGAVQPEQAGQPKEVAEEHEERRDIGSWFNLNRQ
uniref:Glutamate rich 5 n=1 Tax=Bursaphelenchus xylophilus TaxID=6326 RepID=A0A1I7SPJ3_BURXY